MLRSGMIALRLGRKTTERSSCPLHSIVLQNTFSSKETPSKQKTCPSKPSSSKQCPSKASSKDANRLTKDATRIAQDAGRIAQDSSKKLVRAFEELTKSNEVKLVRLTAERACKVGKKLFSKHVVKNPQFQSFLVSLKNKLEDIPIPPPDAKSKSAEPGKTAESKKLASGGAGEQSKKKKKSGTEKDKKCGDCA